MKPLFLLVVLLLAPLAALCQNAKIDSLKRVIETTKVDTVRGRSLCRLSKELANLGELDSGLAAGIKGIDLLKEDRGWTNLPFYLNQIGLIYQFQGNYKEAIKFQTKSLNLFWKYGNDLGAASVLGSIGSSYFGLGNYPQALKYYQQSLKAFEAINHLEGIASSHNNLGNIHFSKPDYAKAAHAYRMALLNYKRLGDSIGQANAYTNLGNILLRQKDLDSAFCQYTRALQFVDPAASPHVQAHILANLGNLMNTKGQYAQALPYLRKALEIREYIQDSAGIGFTYSLMAESHLMLYQFDQAKYFSGRGLRLARAMGHLDHQLACAQVLYQADSALGNWQSAFEAARLCHIYSDSLKNDEKSREIGRLEAEYAAEKEREILEARQQAELQKRNWILGSTSGALLLLLIIAFTLFLGRQKEKKANAALRLLNEQIIQQKAEIEAQNSEITTQRDQLNDSHQRLVALDRMKEELSGMIVHDLKNPLNAVLAMAALPPEPKRLQIIRGAGQQMSQLILNLLDVQKYEEAALVLNPETAPVVDLLNRAAEQTEFLAEQKQIRFQIEADPRLAAEADAELIVRVLVNLLTNAIKYAPAGDAIEIQAIYDPERGAVFRVTDHGKGIPPDQLDRIFDKFSQVDGGQASGKLRSTGLGLTFCRLTVKAHGGSIGVLSEVRRYTTFEFNLPKASVAEQAFVTRTSKEAPVIGPLSAELLSQHAQLLAELRAVPIYSVSDLLDLLERLPDQPVELAAWKAAVESAALSANEARFRELLG